MSPKWRPRSMAHAQAALLQQCGYCGRVSEGGKYHEQQCSATVAVPAPTEPSGATELPEMDDPLTSAERGPAWSRLYERFGELPIPPERVWEIEARAHRIQAKYEAMREDRDLWQDAHNDDCPNLAKLEAALREIAELRGER